MSSKRSPRKTSGNDQAARAGRKKEHDEGKLLLALKNGSGQPIVARSRVVVRDEAPLGQLYRAAGKAGEVTHFTFELPVGVYSIHIHAEGFKEYGQSVRVDADKESLYEFFLEPEDPHQNRGKGEGDSELLRGRFEWFAKQRLAAQKKFPSDARQQALEQKKRMLDPEVINRGFKLQLIKDPLPKTSFGSIGAFAQVDATDGKASFRPSLLAIPYDTDLLGWVDENTLRVFEIDVKKRQYSLAKESGVDTQRHHAYARIGKPGTYGVIGWPKDPAVAQTVRLFCDLQPQLAEEARRGSSALQDRICQLILCAAEFGRTGALGNLGSPDLPGGVGGNVCDYCTGINVPEGGLPECGLVPAGPVVTPGCNWLSIGPRNINGRIRALAIHPTDGNSVYAGSANAGVWVTRDAGESWKPLMHDQAALEIGAVTVHLTDPANPAGDVTIYAGTGEPTYWPGYKGIGVLKSLDSGTTWNTTGVMPAPGNDRFSAILIDPTSVTANPATTVVYAGGTPGGLYKSTNGGAVWTLMLNKNITGLAMDPVNPTIIYAAVANEGIYEYDPVMNTWNPFNTAFPAAIPQLCLIAIGQSAPHTLYAKFDQTVYKYDTGLASWQSLGNHGGTTYGYWNNVLGVDPQDSNIVFAGGIGLERSFDGGASWQPMVGGLHSDQHALVFDSTNHLNVYAGNDGGAYRGRYMSPADVGTWAKVSDGLILTAFNQIGTSPAGWDVLGGGAQDNGTNRTVGGLTYDNIYGADGGFLVYDPANPYILYAEIQSGGGMGKSTNGGASWAGAGTGFPGGPWVTPIAIDPNSPPEPNRVLFAGGNNQVYRTINSAGNWSPSSPNVGGGVIAIALAPSTSAIVYAGSDSGTVWRSSDNGATMGNWKNITIGTIGGTATLPSRAATDIGVHPTMPDTVFITFGGFGGATSGHVYRATSTDGYTTWTWDNVSSNLPDTPVNAIQVDPTSPNTLYIGTDVGVFRTTDGGISWAEFGSGLPNVVVSDLAMNPTGDKLRAATYGYGMWEIELAGTCPAVDVYVRDNKLDTGEMTPSPDNVPDPTLTGAVVRWWESADIKVDAYPYSPADPLFDGVEFDLATAEDPVRNDAGHPNPNHIYIQVHNRGPLSAHNVKVKVLYADASAGLPTLPADFWSSYPNDWATPSSWNTVDPLTPFQNIPELLPHTPMVLMWNWAVPVTANQHTCMLAVISADEDPVVHSDANPNDHLPWIVVPNDKHITLRNLHVITGTPPGGSPGPMASYIDFHNPLPFPAHFDFLFDLSLLPKGTKISLLLPRVETQAIITHGLAKGIAVSTLTGKEWWWGKVKGISKRGWHYDCRLVDSDPDPCSRRRLSEIHGILVPAGKKVRAALIVGTPPNARPGSTYRFTVMQQRGTTMIGGSTYEIRIPPAEVSGRK